MATTTTTPIATLVTEKLLTALDAQHVDVVDCSEDSHCNGAKLEVLVVTHKFEGVSLLKRHRMVNAALSENELMDQIHALTIKAWTPQQYESKREATTSSSSS